MIRAFAGALDVIPVQGIVRRQWVGMVDAPVSQMISSHGYLGNNFGIGGVLFNEATGPNRRTGGSFTTAYHLNVAGNLTGTQEQVISFALTANFTQHVLDKSRLTTYIPDDPTLLSAYNNQMVPDASLGVLYRNAHGYRFGLSAFNLIQTNKDIYNIANPMDIRLVRNYNLYGAYDHEFNDMWSVHPSFMFRMIEALPMQFDINVRGTYKHKFWLGTSYSHKDAVSIVGGVNLLQLGIGYSYDFTTSEIRNYSYGSHEFTIVYHIHGGGGFEGRGVAGPSSGGSRVKRTKKSRASEGKRTKSKKDKKEKDKTRKAVIRHKI